MTFQQKCVFATLPRTTRGQAMVLNGDPKGKNFLYTHGTSVIIRNIENPLDVDIYTEHPSQVNVAKYSPSGFYIASGDSNGRLRIWDTVNKEHILKNEFTPIAGSIKDISWTSDNQRIAVCGEGREKFAHVINAETGTSVGDISTHSKVINGLDFRPARPFKLVTCSDDQTAAFFAGPPFKFVDTLRDHTNFVNTCRYSPTGDVFVTAGSDKKVFIYDGKSAEKKGELEGHKGGIYAVSFSPDGKSLLSASGDKTCKIWDIETQAVVTDFPMGTAMEDMQQGCLWQGDHLLSVSLSGYINYLDRNNPATPLRVLKGHNKAITAMTVADHGSCFYTGAMDGQIYQWNPSSAESAMFGDKKSSHSNQVTAISAVDDTLYSIGMDDCLKISSRSSGKYGESIKMPSQPRGLWAVGNMAVIACYQHAVLVADGRIVCSEPVDYEPQCAAMSPDQSQVALGSATSDAVHVLSVQGHSLAPLKVIELKGQPYDVCYSPDGTYLATADNFRKVGLWRVHDDYEEHIYLNWSAHTGRVSTLGWNETSGRLASGAVDSNAIVWDPARPLWHNKNTSAHKMSNVNCVRWLDNDTLLTVAQDSNIKQWVVTD